MSTSRDDFGIAIRSALLQRGAKQKFSLFVLIIVSIAIFSLDTIKLKPVEILRGLVNDAIYRVSAISSSPIKFSSATKDFFVKHIFLYEENEQLKLEIEKLRKESLNSLYLETENKKRIHIHTPTTTSESSSNKSYAIYWLSFFGSSVLVGITFGSSIFVGITISKSFLDLP